MGRHTDHERFTDVAGREDAPPAGDVRAHPARWGKLPVFHVDEAPPARAGLWRGAGTANAAPRVSILVLTRDGTPLVDRMLRSFQAFNSYPNHEFVIVDHGSTDGALELLDRWATVLPLRTISRGANFSFSNSNNKAARFASGELLLLLNNDTVFTSDCLPAMVAALSDETVGAVGVKQFSDPPAGEHAGKIHHIGVRFRWSREERRLQPHHVKPKPADLLLASAPASFPAVTASVLMCRKRDYLAVGGLDEGYDYGLEDLDFCCKLRRQLGKTIVCLNDLSAVHDKNTTRNRDLPAKLRQDRKNQQLFQRRWGYAMRREYLAALLDDDGSITGKRFTVGVTLADPGQGAGPERLDPARGLGRALNRCFGWDVRYLPRSRWLECAGLDLYVTLQSEVDMGALEGVEPHLVTAAWARGSFQDWFARPWLDRFDLRLFASSAAADEAAARRSGSAELFPNAVSTEVFGPGPRRPGLECDLALVRDRDLAALPAGIERLDPAGLPGELKVFGTGWEDHPRLGPLVAPASPDGDLRQIYNSARLVIDGSGALNGPSSPGLAGDVLDALAAGCLVLTNDAAGAAELFADQLPVWRDGDDLAELSRDFVAHADKREALTQALRQVVISHHTYEARARRLQQLVRQRLEALRVAIKRAGPDGRPDEEALVGAMTRALAGAGFSVRVDRPEDWYGARSLADDAAIVLEGAAYRPAADQINVLWSERSDASAFADTIHVPLDRRPDHLDRQAGLIREMIGRRHAERLRGPVDAPALAVS